MKWLLRLSAVLLLCFLLYAGWIKFRSARVPDGGLPLAIRWEGFYHDMNYRDLGASLNSCLNKQFFREGVILRSAGWFSGWDCETVGNPDVIYSLNFSPDKAERYFCQSDDQKQIGYYFNFETRLSDLEFLESWDNRETKTATCRFIKDIFISVLEDKKALIHCDAGRDRTGAMAAILTALAAESVEKLDSRMLEAIECDYRKTESLQAEKYGRMRHFISEIERQGGMSRFISAQCNVSPEVIALFADKMLATF